MSTRPRQLLAVVALAAAALFVASARPAEALIYRYRTATDEYGPATIYYHLNAQFGADSYDTQLVPVVAMLPSDGCTTVPPSQFAPTGKIVMIARGDCTFAHKGYMAQQLGALGAVIGSGPDVPDDSVVPMGANSTDGEAASTTIPVVSIAQNDFDSILSQIVQANSRGETALAQLNDDGRISLDDAWKLNSSLRFLTIIILVLPGIWLMCFLFYWGRRQCALRANRQQRQRVASSIPLTPFHREAHMDAAADETKGSDGGAAAPAVVGGAVGGSVGASNSGSGSGSVSSSGGGGGGRTRRRIHNSSCAVCLDDFKENEMVKVLPCQHAFHAPCIDPWLDERSDACPICKQSIVVGAASVWSHCACCWRSRDAAAQAAAPANAPNGAAVDRDVPPPVVRANSDFQPLELHDVPATPGRSTGGGSGNGNHDGAAAAHAPATPGTAPASADGKAPEPLQLSLADDAV